MTKNTKTVLYLCVAAGVIFGILLMVTSWIQQAEDTKKSQNPNPASTQKQHFITVPDFTNANAATARDKLETLGLKYDYDQDVWLASNWTVQSQEPVEGSRLKKGATVYLKVFKPQLTTAPTKSAQTSSTPNDDYQWGEAEDGTNYRLAAAYCDLYGKTHYPRGWEPQWQNGILTAKNEGPNYELKVHVYVTAGKYKHKDVIMQCIYGPKNGEEKVLKFLLLNP